MYCTIIWNCDHPILATINWFINIAESNEVVVINFYATWCRFSRQLEPIYEEACKEVRKLHPEPSKVVMGSVDVDAERKYLFK